MKAVDLAVSAKDGWRNIAISLIDAGPAILSLCNRH